MLCESPDLVVVGPLSVCVNQAKCALRRISWRQALDTGTQLVVLGIILNEIDDNLHRQIEPQA